MNLKVYVYFLLLCLGLATHTPARAADPVPPENTTGESQGQRSRWWCQISLRNLMLGTAAIGAGLGLWRYEQNQRDEVTKAWAEFDPLYANQISHARTAKQQSQFNDEFAVFLANFGFAHQMNRLRGIRRLLTRYPELEHAAQEFPLEDNQLKVYLGYETWLKTYKTKKQPGYPLTTPIYRQRMERFEDLMKKMVAQMEADFPGLTPEQIDRMIFESSFKQP